MSNLRSKGTLGKRSRKRNVFLQLVNSKSNTYSSHGDTTATCRPRESDSAYWVGHNVLLPPEVVEHIPLTLTASAAVDTQNTVNFNDRVMNDNDEPWATEADHRTGWNKTFKSGTYRGIVGFGDDSHQRVARHSHHCENRRDAETAHLVCTVLSYMSFQLENQTS